MDRVDNREVGSALAPPGGGEATITTEAQAGHQSCHREPSLHLPKVSQINPHVNSCGESPDME